MRSINKVIIIGNLTRDPEAKSTQNGQLISTFGVATNRQWTTNSHEQKASTEFHEVVAWGRLAEFANRFLKKGKLVYLEGYLKTRSWETEDGDKRFRTEIVLQDLIILSKKENGHEEDDQFLSPNSPEDLEETPETMDGENMF